MDRHTGHALLLRIELVVVVVVVVVVKEVYILMINAYL